MRPAFPTLILAAGLMLAAAAPALSEAAPSGPDALPAQIVGVVGSGDQLSLRLRASPDAPARMVRLGEEAIDGWTLSGLTDSVATLSKDGQFRAIGLNPTGALDQARPAGPPTTVRMTIDGLTPEMADILGLNDEALIAQMPAQQRDWYETTTPERGLTAEEGKRLKLYTLRFSMLSPMLMAAAQARARAAAAQGVQASTNIATDPVAALLFGQDYIDLVGKQRQFDYQQQLAAYEAATAGGARVVELPRGQAFLPGMQPAAFDAYFPPGYVLVTTPPTAPGPVDQPYRYTRTPSLTAEMVATMTMPDGTPASDADKAAALAGNQRILAAQATQREQWAAATYFGPFGEVPGPSY